MKKKDNLLPSQPHEDSWPPTPTVPFPFTQEKGKLHWFRLSIWLGVAFNLLVCLPALLLLKEPYGSELMSDDLEAPFWLAFYGAPFAVIIGVPFVIWQMRTRQKSGQSIVSEWIGLVLCLTPFPVSAGVTLLIESAKAFDSLS